MNALSSILPHVYRVGPFLSFLNQSPQNHLASLGSNLWKEDTEFLKWLESKEPESVVYVNFGNTTVMSPEQLFEFAWDEGLIGSWCPQEQVLNHPSVGGFLTYYGWNSTIESICAGVPMLCWPIVADRPTNCRYICNEWGIGIEIDTNVKREEMEKVINELMVGKKAKTMRQKVMELRKKAEEYTKLGGRSYMNLDIVISEVLLKQNLMLLKQNLIEESFFSIMQYCDNSLFFP
ncbi:7-deoxyloganetin glucosyltransferase [Spatholobus suberectus]|nr:7-deoxyloganetin glucosyltransferase [Spatholobus suberectus]